MPGKKSATAIAKPKQSVTSQSHKLVHGTYFKAFVKGKEHVGIVSLSPGILNLIDASNGNGFVLHKVMYKTPGRISDKKLAEEGIIKFKIIRKSDYTKALNKTKLKEGPVFKTFAGWNVKKVGKAVDPIYKFGCGAVQLYENQIRALVSLNTKLGGSAIGSNSINIILLRELRSAVVCLEALTGRGQNLNETDVRILERTFGAKKEING